MTPALPESSPRKRRRDRHGRGLRGPLLPPTLPGWRTRAERFDELMSELPRDPEGSQYLGQDLISQVFHRYPQIAHLVPRDLLWFFGGDCLHFMPDEEIDLYQRLDERRFEAEQNDEPFDWNQEKQLLALPDDGSKH